MLGGFEIEESGGKDWTLRRTAEEGCNGPVSAEK